MHYFSSSVSFFLVSSQQMDFHMPNLNGPDATKKIRRNGHEQCFIVGVTGTMFPEDTQAFLSSGANAVLPKPFKMEALNVLWDEHFQQHDH